MTADLFPVDVDFERDGYGRPLIVPEHGGKPVAYTRCTTFVSALEDTAKLADWKQRMVALGLSRRNDLLLRAASLDVDDRKGLDELCTTAREAAAASAAATTGTALHKLTELVDQGADTSHLPPDAKRDLEAYARATQPLTALRIEQHLVLDDWKIAGTADRIVEYQGRRYIADIKTGRVDYGQLKIAMQLAVYAHGDLYDVKSGRRSPMGEIDQQRGIVIHLPAGSGTCELMWADIGQGWEALPLAKQVREWRTRGRKMLASLTAQLDDPLPLPKADDPQLVALRNDVASATSVKQLTDLWGANQQLWTDELTELAKARRQLLEEDRKASA